MTDKIYLDYNATTPLALEVIEGIKVSLIEEWGNPSCGHLFGKKAKDSIENARKQIAEMLNGRPSDIIFTSGGTEANNMIIHSALKYFRLLSNTKGHVITSNVEHDAVLLPLVKLKDEGLIDITYVKADNDGCVNVADIVQAIQETTFLITIMYANNETGVIMPIEEIGEKLLDINKKRENMNKCKILFHTDGAQIIGKDRIDVNELNADYFTVVGHKFYGPRIGCVWSKGPLYPMLFGGGQEKNLRPGTENTPMIVGLGKAAELVTKNINEYSGHFLILQTYLESQLIKEFGDKVVINCKSNQRLKNTSSVSFLLESNKTGRDVLENCFNVIASVGAACHSNTTCSQILLNSGVAERLAKTAVRLSTGRSTNKDDVNKVVIDLKQAFDRLESNKK